MMQGLRHFVRGAAIMLMVVAVPLIASAGPTIVISPGKAPVPMPIAVPDFAGDRPTTSSLADKSLKLLRLILNGPACLRPSTRRRLFRIRHPCSRGRDLPIGAQSTPRRWCLVPSRHRPTVPSTCKRVFSDVFGQAEMGIDPAQQTGMGYTVTTRTCAAPRICWPTTSMASLPAGRGFFDARIVYVSERPEIKSVKRLAIMDQDGGNHRIFRRQVCLCCTPRWRPMDITWYVLLRHERAAVYLGQHRYGPAGSLG